MTRKQWLRRKRKEQVKELLAMLACILIVQGLVLLFIFQATKEGVP